MELQREFYSGHRHYHLTQYTVDCRHSYNIVFLQVSFLGSMNDAGNYWQELVLGQTAIYGVVLLADKGYADVDTDVP